MIGAGTIVGARSAGARINAAGMNPAGMNPAGMNPGVMNTAPIRTAAIRTVMTRAVPIRAVVFRAVVTMSVAGALAVAIPPALATAQDRDIIERVVAVVDEEAIFLSDVRRKALPFLPTIAEQPAGEARNAALRELYSRTLEGLIDEELIDRQALEMDIRISRADVERAIENLIEQNNLTEDEFWAAVEGQGLTRAQYRRDLRNQLLRLRVLRTRIQGRVNITEAQVRERYDQEVRRANLNTCFRISVRVFPVPPNGSATDVAAARNLALSERERLTPLNFADEGGIDLGTVCEGQMQPAIDVAVGAMREDQISTPIRTENGFVLVHLKERVRGGGNAIPDYEDVRQQIFQRMQQEAIVRQEQVFLQELRRSSFIENRL
ncbi:MAG: SurA N-terminal domain-containing protein [Myxococcota bacterium]